MFDEDYRIRTASDFQFSINQKFNRILVKIQNSKEYQIFDSDNKRIIKNALKIDDDLVDIYNQ